MSPALIAANIFGTGSTHYLTDCIRLLLLVFLLLFFPLPYAPGVTRNVPIKHYFHMYYFPFSLLLIPLLCQFTWSKVYWSRVYHLRFIGAGCIIYSLSPPSPQSPSPHPLFLYDYYIHHSPSTPTASTIAATSPISSPPLFFHSSPFLSSLDSLFPLLILIHLCIGGVNVDVDIVGIYSIFFTGYI